MNRFWQALEQFWGLSTSRLSWQQHLGAQDLSRYELLVATDQLASILPVIDRPHEWLDVSEFEEGVFEGYNVKTEEYVPIDRRDLICYELSVAKLGKVLSNLIGFAPQVEPLADTEHCFTIGQFGGTSGAGFAMYFANRILDAVQLKD